MSRMIVFALVIVATVLSGCSKESSVGSTVDGVIARFGPKISGDSGQRNSKVKFEDLDNFVGKPPSDLLEDDSIEAVIRSIVPQSRFKCMDDLFNYMRDLEATPAGGVTSELNGSHADNFMEAFISVSPSGAVHLVLQCDPHGNPKGKYYYFTNAGMNATVPKPLLNWMYIVGREEDEVTKSDGKKRVSIAFDDFVGKKPLKEDDITEVATASRSKEEINRGSVEKQKPSDKEVPNGVEEVNRKEPAVQVPSHQLQTYIAKGATVCLEMKSMQKAMVIARANNPYIDIPDDCMIVPQNTPLQSVRNVIFPGMVVIQVRGVRMYASGGDLVSM